LRAAQLRAAQLRAAYIAQRNRANRAAQLPPRNSRRAAAPTHRAKSFTPSQ
jgi:hypothetical protein